VSFSIIGALVSLVTTVLSTIGLPGLFALMLVGTFGIPPVPSEIVLPFAGFLVVEGVFPFWGALLTALAGGLAGALLGYAVGRWWRHRLTDIGVGKLRLDEKHLARVDRFFVRRGELAVAGASMLPVLRAYVSYPAGTARMNPVRFSVYQVVGSTPYTIAFLYAGMVLRSDWNVVSQWFQVLDIVLIALIAAAVIYLVLCAVGVLESFTLHRPRAPALAPDVPDAGRAPPPS
jgi:membrane protein DedA with SNARE-associated domain